MNAIRSVKSNVICIVVMMTMIKGEVLFHKKLIISLSPSWGLMSSTNTGIIFMLNAECEHPGAVGCSLFWTGSVHFLFAARCWFSLFARGYMRSGLLHTINCNLQSETKEFAQLLLSDNSLAGYHHPKSKHIWNRSQGCDAQS